MDHPLMPRDRCLRLLRDGCQQDAWTAFYALELACNRLDLNQLNEVVDLALPVGEVMHRSAYVALRELMRERFGE